MKHLLLNIAGGVLLSGATLLADTLIPAGAKTSWRYWDSAAAPAAAWRESKFDDTSWQSGPAPLGCDERGLRTRVCAGATPGDRPSTAYFRTTFSVADTNAAHGLVLMLRADDGVVAYLNGGEVARFNMPDGEVTHSTRARAALESFREEEYHRFLVPARFLRPGRNVLAASVHQWNAPGDDLIFDLALRAPPEPLRIGQARVAPAAQGVTQTYLQHHRVGPELRIPDGYIDGGRSMRLDRQGHAESSREILVVSRPDDPSLRRHLVFARSPELQSLAPLPRATGLARYVANELSLPDGPESTLAASMLLTAEYANSPLLFGKMAEECPAGVCRHRALLFKLMADEAGLKVALVRGNMKTESAFGGHAWNELHLDDGRRLLVDIMNPQPDFRFPALTEPVARRYLSVSNVPLYADGGSSGPLAPAANTGKGRKTERQGADTDPRPHSAEKTAEPSAGEGKLIGKWKAVVTAGDQTGDYEFRFEKIDGKLAGTLISPRSGEYKAKTTTFKDDQLLMEVERNMQGTTVTQVYKGQLADNTLSGSLTVKGREDEGSLQFKATKAAKETAAPGTGDSKLPGLWKVAVTQGDQTSDYEFRFAKVGGKLAGTLISPRSGEFKAKTITFNDGQLLMEVDRDSQGKTLTMIFKGQLADDTLSGPLTIKGYEGQPSFQFKATKAK